MKKPLILVINPGSTSTKIAIYNDQDCVNSMDISHTAEELSVFKRNLDQMEFRTEAVHEALADWKIEIGTLSAIIGRGGPLKPLTGGVYRVDDTLMSDLLSGVFTDHASILGGIIAGKLAKSASLPAFIADPVSVDEFDDIARISGCPELPRYSLSHALNIKSVASQYAHETGKRVEDLNLVVAHLGGGISIAAHKQGRQVDVNNANDGGPFSPERVGTLPLTGLLKMCFSGEYTHNELKKKLIGKGGLMAHLGTADAREVVARIESGDKKAALILDAMIYTISKEIGAMAVVMFGKVDAIILTGGLAHQKRIVDGISERVSFIAPIIVKPGQNEMKALATHALNALENPSIIKKYV
ncbi:MAG: butyrate kinase [Candidatus Riflebacteria bacterium]|nr:butyrate kinase [Candidatus Riflebacteria bacterium]